MNRGRKGVGKRGWGCFLGRQRSVGYMGNILYWLLIGGLVYSPCVGGRMVGGIVRR